MGKSKGHNNWGGKRKNQTGRPPKQKVTISDSVKDSIRKAAEELAEEYGETIEKSMMRLCFTDKAQAAVKASVFKSYLESMVVKETKTENTVEDKRGPRIGLPPIKGKDPALKVVGKNE